MKKLDVNPRQLEGAVPCWTLQSSEPSINLGQDLDINDSKGRAVGVNIWCFSERREPVSAAMLKELESAKTIGDKMDIMDKHRPEGALYGYSDARPGVYLIACAHAARDGVNFGASQPYHYFLTNDDRAAWAADYIERFRKRECAKLGRIVRRKS